jgi:hypothetical protein
MSRNQLLNASVHRTSSTLSVRKRLAGTAILCIGSVFLATGIAGTRPQVDLSLQVTTTPVPFVPGGHGTVTLTVHNGGPDAAGATLPNQETINVYEDAFIITHEPPPFAIPVQGDGCTVDTFISEPLPNGDIALVYFFYFGPIAAGESRTCTYGIDFYPSTRHSFATGWFVASSNDDDTDSSNDRVDYIFQAPVVSIPTATRHGLVTLAISLLLLGWIGLRRRFRTRATQRAR